MPKYKELYLAERAKNDILQVIIADLHWMARRYADGRRTYVPKMLNDHV